MNARRIRNVGKIVAVAVLEALVERLNANAVMGDIAGHFKTVDNRHA